MRFTRNFINTMVKVLLQAHEVRRLDCAQMIKEKLIWYVQRLKCSNFQHYTCRHAELDEHGLMTWALKKYMKTARQKSDSWQKMII